ncbi:MAG: ligase-associated DNA damage response endonuclease PdeM [Paracoccaceae bacterium]
MNTFSFSLAGHHLEAMDSGALWWPKQRLLCLSDLHLGKAERHLRRGGPALPPYETQDTLNRLSADLDRTQAQTIVCLGDSFDDSIAADALPERERLTITGLQAGRRWIWIEGNHDPGPLEMSGEHLSELTLSGLNFRHIAQIGAAAEISGHYHPKVRLRSGTKRAFLTDRNRLIMPAYGTYTGGLRSDHNALQSLMAPDALAILVTTPPLPVPMPRV